MNDALENSLTHNCYINHNGWHSYPTNEVPKRLGKFFIHRLGDFWLYPSDCFSSIVYHSITDIMDISRQYQDLATANIVQNLLPLWVPLICRIHPLELTTKSGVDRLKITDKSRHTLWVDLGGFCMDVPKNFCGVVIISRRENTLVFRLEKLLYDAENSIVLDGKNYFK